MLSSSDILRENDGAILTNCLAAAHSTTTLKVVTIIYARQGRRWCYPLLAFRERTLLLSSRCVLSTRPVKRAILAAKAHS